MVEKQPIKNVIWGMVYEIILATWQEHKLKQSPCKTLFIACV